MVLMTELRASCMPGKHSTELPPKSCMSTLIKEDWQQLTKKQMDTTDEPSNPADIMATADIPRD